MNNTIPRGHTSNGDFFMYKLSKVSFFIFTFFYNYLWLRILLVRYLYNDFKESGWLILLIIIVMISFILIILPKKILNFNYLHFLDIMPIKVIYTLLNILEVGMLIGFGVNVLSKEFIIESNPFIMILVVSICIMLIGKLKHFEIINLSTLFYLFGVVLIVFSLFFVTNINKEVYDLFIVNNSNFLSAILLGLIIVINNFKIILNKEGLYFKKNVFIIAVIFSLLFLLIEYGLLIIRAGGILFKDINHVGFLCLSFMPVTRYLGDFNFIYIYLIIISLVFKSGFDITHIPKGVKYYACCFLIFVIGLFLHMRNYFINYLGFIVLVLEAVFIILLIVSELIVRKYKK